MTWDNVTLGQFMQFTDCLTIEDPLQLTIQRIMIFRGLTAEDVEKLTLQDVNAYSSQLALLNLDIMPDDKCPPFTSDGLEFMPVPLVDRMEAKRYLDYKAILKSIDVEDEAEKQALLIANYNRLLACFIKCDTLAYDNEVYSKHALNMPVRTALGMAAFFLSVSQEFARLFEQAQQEQRQAMTS